MAPLLIILYNIWNNARFERILCIYKLKKKTPYVGVAIRLRGATRSATDFQHVPTSFFYLQCAYKPLCLRKGNDLDVKKYQQNWGVAGKSFHCYYNPEDLTMVFKKRRLSHQDMLHCLLWPALITLTFIIMLVVVVLTCGCDFIWTQRPPSVLSDYGIQADGHLYHHHHHHHNYHGHHNSKDHHRGRCLCSRNGAAAGAGSEDGSVLIQAPCGSVEHSKEKAPIAMAEF